MCIGRKKINGVVVGVFLEANCTPPKKKKMLSMKNVVTNSFIDS